MTDAVRLTDRGLETPDHLIGRTGQVKVEKPDIAMTFTFTGEGVPEYSELVSFPPTDPRVEENVPEGYVRIAGEVYEVVDERTFNTCPECGSDKVTETRCYTCDVEFDR